MSKAQTINNHHFHSQQFEIRIKEYLASDWSDWFEGLSITHNAERQTLLSGAIQDQSALHGLLARIRDLGLTLISVRQISPKPLEHDNRGK